ncbi:MAG: DUF308 domain-containing protein [Firmicutes bacterium]|nr:DUF308 domain-containing protein [Bacillota bacterium]
MRIITMLTGVLFSATGIFLVANGGLTFMSMAFIVGLVFAVAGVVECLSYSGYRGEDEVKSWIMIDGTCTFMLGALILMNKLSAEAAVPLVLGLWILFSGIRNFVHAWEKIDVRGEGFYNLLVIGLVNIILGLYAFFDQDLFDLSTVTLVGIYMITGGINIANVGATIKIRKPDFLKTKEEKMEEAAAKAEEAHQAAKEAIKFAKETRAELRVICETPAEELDLTLAPKPGTEKPAEDSEMEG